VYRGRPRPPSLFALTTTKRRRTAALHIALPGRHILPDKLTKAAEGSRTPKVRYICPLMKRIALVLVLLVACATQPREDAAAAVQLRERQWLDAYEQRDAVAMQQILHDHFVITYPDGSTQTKDDVLAFIRRAAGKSSPRFHTEGTKAHVAGQTVVLTGLVVTERSDSRSEQLYTDTWVFDRGAWRVLASQLAAAPKPEHQ
jgi:ketosteroid isomerase-like protein